MPETTAQTHTNLALAPHPNHQPLTATPTPEPPATRHQAQGVNYPGPTPHYGPQAPMQPPYDIQANMPPPHVPQPYQQLARRHPASIQLDGTQVQRHHPYQRPNKPYPPHQPHYQHWENQRGGRQAQTPFRGSRGSRRNWNPPMANTHRVINVGEFLMRLTRSNGRGCGRGRGRGFRQ